MKAKKQSLATISRIVQLPLVREAELLCVLHRFFKYVSNPLAEKARRFGDKNSSNYLDVFFKKDGTITRVEGVLDDTQEAALADQVRLALLENQKESFAQTFCFSRLCEVRGFYRYGDIFQIIPIPVDAPHAPMIVADHPFILQFKYVSCADGEINGFRRSKKEAELTRVLNLLCCRPISSSSRYVRRFWGIGKNAANEHCSSFLQEGYGYREFTPELKEFSDMTATPQIRSFPTAEYYDSDFFAGDYDLTFPDYAKEYLDKFFSLMGENAKRFNIASSWFSQVNGLWHESSSAALVAVVSAIEALLEKSQETCKVCGHSKHEITKRFKAFLKQHVPRVESQFPEEFKAIYKTRSTLAHGDDLLVADLEHWNYFGTPLQQWQDDFQRNTHYITATALRNWALASERHPQEHEITKSAVD
jgi:hypothetical protein